MIYSFQELPVTAQSKPFSEAAERCALQDYGYEEHEYLFSGSANVYGTMDDGKIKTEYAAVPYTNRMVVRRPSSIAKFNGHVIVEIINASARYDIERMWIVSRRFFMNRGAIYVGLTSKPDVFDALKKYDEQRYSALSWPNPRPAAMRKQPLSAGGRPAFMREDQECGLIWDMLTEVADLLRSNQEMNPLRAYPVQYVSLTGWSQSSAYLARYVNSFAYRNDRLAPVYDGYFAAGGVFTLSVPVNQNEYFAAHNNNPFIRHIEQPLVMVQTESENGSFGIMNVPRGNREEPGLVCRIYEIAGSTHDYRRAMNDYYKDDPKIDGVNYPSVYRGAESIPNDFPCEYPMNAAYHHFFSWLESGITPKPTPLFVRDDAGNNVTDALGNALGGMRTAFVDMPTRRYIPWSTWRVEGQDQRNHLYGHEEKYSAAFLKELYGSLAEYEKRVRQVTTRHILEGFVLKEEAELLIRDAVQLAAEGGLH